MASGNPGRLGIRSPTSKRPEATRERAAQTVAAWNRRLTFARTSVLFSALAAEAAANFYIAAALVPADAEALESLSTPRKLLIAPQVGGHGRVFRSGEEPMGRMTRLFKLRNALVHPKVGAIALRGDRITGKDGYAGFNPRVAADVLIGTRDVLARLAEVLGQPSLCGATCDVIRGREDDIRRAARGWTEQLPTPPSNLVTMLLEGQISVRGADQSDDA
jgi:hypothetical protein